MDRPTVDQRIITGTAATLTVEWTDAEGELAGAVGTVTVEVRDANNQIVLASGAATADVTTAGVYTRTLPPQSDVRLLKATWSDAASGVRTTLIDVAGGWWFSVRDARRQERDLADMQRYPTDLLQRVRLEVEDEAEWIMDRSMSRRYRRLILSGSGDEALYLPAGDVRTDQDTAPVISATVDGTLLSGPDLAELAVTHNGMVRRPAGKRWPVGLDNITIEFRYGIHQPPNDLRRAAIQRMRHRANADRSGIPDRARSWTSTDMGTFSLDSAEAYKTGIPDVDAAYARYSRRPIHGVPGAGDIRNVPSSMAMDFDPQRGSVFHGGRR